MSNNAKELAKKFEKIDRDSKLIEARLQGLLCALQMKAEEINSHISDDNQKIVVEPGSTIVTRYADRCAILMLKQDEVDVLHILITKIIARGKQLSPDLNGCRAFFLPGDIGNWNYSYFQDQNAQGIRVHCPHCIQPELLTQTLSDHELADKCISHLCGESFPPLWNEASTINPALRIAFCNTHGGHPTIGKKKQKVERPSNSKADKFDSAANELWRKNHPMGF